TENQASAFHVTLPLEYADKSDDLRALVLDLADLIPFRSGLAGYATSVDEGELSRIAEDACKHWLLRYRGIDSMDVTVTTEYTLNKVKGVSWLTAIDHAFVKKLGGLDALRQKLHPPIVVHERKNGIVIQAGRKPLLIDTYKDDDESLYKGVDEAIRPVR